MLKKTQALILCTALLCVFTSCFDPPNDEHPEEGFNIPDLRKQPESDGINLKNLDRFWEKWNLVTVRYRKDNGEQRFIYANSIAWEAMRKRKLPYPDGSIFGKISFHSGEDHAFPVSEVPEDLMRIQIMEKNSTRYSDTDGWGYALVVPLDSDDFSNAKLDTTRKQAIGCHSCHRIVPNRDFVFEDFPVFYVRKDDMVAKRRTGYQKLFKEKFTERFTRDLDPRDQKLIKLSKVDVLTPKFMFLSMPLFSGSISESASSIARYSVEDQQPYLILDPSTEQFVAAFPNKKGKPAEDKACDPTVTLLMSQYMRFTGLPVGLQIPENLKDLPSPYALGYICKNKITWVRTQQH